MSGKPGNPKVFADINKELQDKQDLEEAELLNDDFGDEDDMINVTPEPEPEQTPKEEDKTKLKQEVLTSLGFKQYDNGEQGLKYTMLLWHNDMNLKLGKTFKTNGSHFWWAFQKDSDPNDPKRMLKSDAIAKIPLVHLYNEIVNGAIESPAKTLIGHVHRRVGKSLVIAFESPEQYEEKGASFGEGAVKSDVEGHFIAASFSIATKTQSGKMKVPRCIRLPNFETEMDTAPKEDKQATAPIAGNIPVKGEELQIKSEGHASLQKREQEIIDKASMKLSACTLAAKKLVNVDYQDLSLTDCEQGKIRHAIAATLLIQATRGGL